MEPFRYHIFVCDQQKPEGIPSCSARGSGRVLEVLRREIAAQGLTDAVQLTTCGSLGLCESGPNMVVYPEGIWYSGLTPEVIPELVRSHFRDGTVLESLARTDTAGLRAEMLMNRSRMQAGMKAKDAAGALPDDLQQVIRGYQESRAILTAVELDIFTCVGEGNGVSEVAAKAGCDARATGMLLNALAGMKLLEKRNDVFYNTPVSGRYLAAGGRDDARAGIGHSINQWARWSTLTEAVRRGTAVAGDDIAARGEEWVEAFIAAMDRNARERAPHVLRAVGTEGIRRMLDIGGGSGAYSIAFAQANTGIRAEIFDLPGVVPIARRHIEKAGLGDRVAVTSGDLCKDPFGQDFDLVFVSAICHMLSPGENLDLFRKCHAALRSGGRLVVQDFILEPDRTAPKSAALFALNMLVGTEAGNSYSSLEYHAWLSQTGFKDVRHVRLPGPSGLMMGVRDDG